MKYFAVIMPDECKLCLWAGQKEWSERLGIKKKEGTFHGVSMEGKNMEYLLYK